MIGNKHSGDNIALEFLRLTSKKSSQAKVLPEKTASDNHVNSAEDGLEEVSPESFLVSNADDNESPGETELENKIEDLNKSSSKKARMVAIKSIKNRLARNNADGTSYASKKGKTVLSGLGKIEGGLRRKGEGFAADMVRATAMSVKRDLVTEAGRKRHVVSELNKIAFSLKNDGEKFASDLVKTTINKLLND